MMGAVIGDIVGSVYEFHNYRSKDFELFTSLNRFTDDTVLTLATAQALMTERDYAAQYRAFARNYPGRGYGGLFREWVGDDQAGPYWSLGNGSAMRVSPVAYVHSKLEAVLEEAKQSAMVTHNHPEGIIGAQAVATAVFMARNKTDVEVIRRAVESRFRYDLCIPIEDIRKTNAFDETCSGTVNIALICALNAIDFEDAIRNAVSVGGDSDTIACIAGSVAEPLFGIPEIMRENAIKYLDEDLTGILTRFERWITQ